MSITQFQNKIETLKIFKCTNEVENVNLQQGREGGCSKGYVPPLRVQE